MPKVATRAPKTVTVWVRSLPSPSTLDRIGDTSTPAGKRRAAHYGNVWHEARELGHYAIGGRPILRTRCGKDVPDYWDPKTRKSEPTKLKENERICQVCTKARHGVAF